MLLPASSSKWMWWMRMRMPRAAAATRLCKWALCLGGLKPFRQVGVKVIFPVEGGAAVDVAAQLKPSFTAYSVRLLMRGRVPGCARLMGLVWVLGAPPKAALSAQNALDAVASGRGFLSR